MPMGQYKNFAACVADQVSKGKSKESADKICGKIKSVTEKAVEAINKSRLVIKPQNKAGNIVGNTQETGSASMSLQRAASLNDVRGATKPKKKVVTKDNESGTDTGAESETASSSNFPTPAQVDTQGPATSYCAYCGAKNPSPQPETDVGTVTILGNTKFAGDDSDRAAENSTTDGNVNLVEKSVKLIKSDQPEEEHYVLGVVLEPEIEDTQRDIYSAEEIRKTAHMFMENFGHIGLQHNGVIDDRAKILESYIAPCDFDLNGQVIQKGTWLLGARILDTDLWEDVKKGSLTGWSMGGSAIRTEENN